MEKIRNRVETGRLWG